MKLLIALLFSVNAMAFTPWAPLPPAEGTISLKGNLLTSNGAAQVEFGACADDEILVWDAAELTGMKCEAKPSGGGASNVKHSATIIETYSGTYPHVITNSAVTITTAGGLVRFDFVGDPAITSFPNLYIDTDGGGGTFSFPVVLLRDGVIVDRFNYSGIRLYDSYISPRLPFTDQPPAGTYTYTLRVEGSALGVSGYSFRFWKLQAEEYGSIVDL